jgi:hypothetical protein
MNKVLVRVKILIRRKVASKCRLMWLLLGRRLLLTLLLLRLWLLQLSLLLLLLRLVLALMQSRIHVEPWYESTFVVSDAISEMVGITNTPGSEIVIVSIIYSHGRAVCG